MTADTLPAWGQWAVSILVIAGSLVTLLGAIGLVRMKVFFQRVHAPVLGSTFGVWSMVLATSIYFSLRDGQFWAHAFLIGIFIAVTSPITTIFLMRAALFRERLAGNKNVPPNLTHPDK